MNEDEGLDAAEPKDGLQNLWGFGWTGGGIVAALLCAGLFAWLYGTAAVGLWGLVQDVRALPVTLKGVFGALAAGGAYLGWLVFQLMKARDAAEKRLAHLEWRVGDLERGQRPAFPR